MKKNFKRLLGLILVIATVVSILGPIRNVSAVAATNKLTITFRNTYDPEQGKVQYSLNDGATWTDVTSDVNNQDITVTGDNLKIRVVANPGWSFDPSGVDYFEDDQHSPLNLQSNSSIVGGLMGGNGYLATSTAQHVGLTDVEFNGGGTAFDGNAILLWSCDGKLCAKQFDINTITNEVDGVKYIAASSITDEIGGTKKFDVNAPLKGWTLPSILDDWSVAYKNYKGIDANTDIDWSTVDPEDIIGAPLDMREWEDKAILANACLPENFPNEDDFHGCVDNYAAQNNVFALRVQLQPVGEPDQQNAYVSYGDRNFKVTIYGDNYKALAIGNLNDLTYYPAIWTDSMFRQDAWDISETTENNPAEITTVLLENTVNLKSTGINGLNLASIKALDVPAGAVNASIVDGNIKVVFSSNFYDNVVFEVKDNAGNKYYIRIKRISLDAWLDHDNHKDIIRGTFYFDRTKSYTDYVIKAKLIYKNGTTKIVKLNNAVKIDMGGANFVYSHEYDEQDPPAVDEKGNQVANFPRGKGLKQAAYVYEFADGELDKIDKVFVNVEKVGSTTTNYAGALVGSGNGIELDLRRGGQE